MITKQHTLASGRTITLGMPNLYELVATDVDIPNQALTDILDLSVHGGMIKGFGDDKKRVEGNRRFLMSQFQLAKLCILDPPLILRGEANADSLTPADIAPRDLEAITDFFLTGGSQGAPTTTDNGLGSGAPADSTSESVGSEAERTN